MVLFCSYCLYLYKDKYPSWAILPYIYRYLHEYFAHESFTHWPDIVMSYCPQLLFFKSSFEFQKVIKASHFSFWPLESQKFLVVLILHLYKCLFIHQKRYTLLSSQRQNYLLVEPKIKGKGHGVTQRKIQMQL